LLTTLAELTIVPFKIEFPDALAGQIVGFVLLVLLLSKLAGPGIKGMLNARSERIAESQDQVDKALSEAKSVYADYSARLAGIEEEQRTRIAEAVRESEFVRTEIVSEAKQAAALVSRRAAEELAREQARQRTLLRRELVQRTMSAAGLRDRLCR